MCNGSHAAPAVKWYFQASDTVASVLAAMFEALFPEEYQKYCAAFDAGAWHIEDSGPWIGRVIVFKLEVNLHADKLDGGPTATFPLGIFEGGWMEVPQLQARFQ